MYNVQCTFKPPQRYSFIQSASVFCYPIVHSIYLQVYLPRHLLPWQRVMQYLPATITTNIPTPQPDTPYSNTNIPQDTPYSTTIP